MMRIKSKVGLRVLAGALLWLLAVGALAAQTIGDLYYNLNTTEKTATVTRKYYDGADIKYSGDIVIPESVTYSGTTYSVTSIGDGAFSGCTGLTSIEIPSSVTEIGERAFSGCTGLTSVAIADRETDLYVVYSSSNVFESCPIRRLYLGGDIDFGGYSPFRDLTTLETLTIGGSATEIDGSVFDGCTGLTSIYVDESNDAYCVVGNVLYNNNKTRLLICSRGKTEFSIPSSVTEIGNFAFAYCTGLTSMEIPNSVTEIGERTFEGCTGLTSIEIPNSVTSIGERAFSGCTGLTSMEIPTSVDTVGYYAFWGCTGLTDVTIADRGTALYFDIPVFASCPIRTLYMGGDIDYDPYPYSGRYSPFFHLTTLETLTIGASVTTLGYAAFAYCTGLMSIEIPNSVTSIGPSAFAYCTGLTSIEIPNSVTAIGAYAFDGCTGLTTFETGDAVKEIGDYAFRQCGGLLSLTFGKSVSQIGESIVDNCDKLRRLICTSEEPASCHTNAFADIHKIRCDLLVPETALEAYKNALVWGDFLRIAGGDGSDKVYVERLSLTSPVTPAKLKVGEGMLLSAVIAPANATNQTLTWSSSDKNVLRVDYDGYVIAVGAGEAVVTARTTDGSNLSATCTVMVTVAGSGDDGGDDGPGDDGDDDKILVETLEISTGGASTELKAGGTLQLRAVVTPANATNKTVTWSSSNKKVATVDNDGYVVALAAGTVVITARTTDGSDLSATCNLKVVGGGNTAVEVPDALKAVRVYAADGHIEVRGLPLGTAVTLSGVDGRLWYQTEAVTGPELTLGAPRGHVYVLRLNHTHSLKVYLP